MSLILGIDTGGTYTDAVIVKKDSNEVMSKAKSFTTHDDLTKGISQCINMLQIDKPSDISEIHISTTLAVNSILERKFEKIGLLQIDKAIAECPPANYVMTINDPFAGNRKLMGMEKLPEILDIRKTFTGNVDYIVVTSPAGTEAKWIEHQIAERVRRDADVEVFCAADYSSAEDYTERTITSMLKLYLLPVVDQWIKSVEAIIMEKGINAQLRIMNAMGKLISCDEARKNPLSTMFSGLAASVIGGLGLTDIRNFLLIDIGGTSSDITRIIDRQFQEVKEWTKIGEFSIRERTMDVQTFGIGGDSHIRITPLGNVIAGPKKAIPICIMTSKYPYLLDELEQCKRPDNYEMLTVQDVDCFIGVKDHSQVDITEAEREIVEYLVDAPHNVFAIADHFDRDPDALHLDDLIRKGVLRVISVTPTDVLHAEKKYTQWDTKGANIAIKHMAKQLKITKAECIETIKDAITEKLIRSCMQSIANFEKEEFDFEESLGAGFMLERFCGRKNSMLGMKFKINKPIVALGAPSGAWIDRVAKALDTEVVVPEHGEVANAYGTAIAEQMRG